MTFRIRKQWRWAVALAAVFVPGIVSGALVLPFKFTAGTQINAADVNANFEALRAKLDSLSGTPVLPTVGTITMPNIVTSAPIRKFTQNITVPASVAGGGAAKPVLGDIEITRDAGTGSPLLNLTPNQGKSLATTDIVLGNLTIKLKNVMISNIKVTGPQADLPQEVISLSFASIEWNYTPPGQPTRTTSYDKSTAVGGSTGALAFKFAYVPAGGTVASGFLPITSYTHGMGCQTALGGAACKPQHQPVSVQRGVTLDTIDEISHVLSGAKSNTLELNWFANATTVNNSIKLTAVAPVGITLTTREDGSFSESVDFSYSTITWTAGLVSAGWDIVGNKQL